MIRDEQALESQPSAVTGRQVRSTGGVCWDPLLSAAEERELADRIKGGDQDARKQLIQANLRVVIEIARRFRNGKVPLDDLVQEGNLGLIRASADFDPSVHGCRFYTYAEVWIRAYIHRTLINNDSLIRVPQHVFLERKRSRRAGSATGGAVTQARPTEVGVEDFARESGSLPGRLDPDRPAVAGRAAHSCVADEGEIVPITDSIVDNQSPDQQAADKERRLLLEIALRRLNPVEAWVIRERYGLCLLIADDWDWSSPSTRGAGRDDPESEADAESDSRGQCRAYFHRSYIELARDCGLSRHRIVQVEETALGKLRDVLNTCLDQAL